VTCRDSRGLSEYAGSEGHYAKEGEYEGFGGDDRFEDGDAEDRMGHREIGGVFTMLVDDNEDEKDEILYF
jgi:hypothetical protein